MRTSRAEQWIRETLTRCGHPDIKEVEPFEHEGVPFPAGSKITLVDGSVVYVKVVGSAPDGGDTNHSNPAEALTDEDRARLP